MTDIDFKILAVYLRDKFSRPFARRFRYLYLGLERTDDILVLSDIPDDEFKYCSPRQATGLMKIRNADHLTMIKAWLLSYGLDGSTPYIFHIGALLTLLTKIKWDMTQIVISNNTNGDVLIALNGEAEEVIAWPVRTYFALRNLQHYVDSYTNVFFDQIIPSHTIPLEIDTQDRVKIIALSCEVLHTAGYLDVPCHDQNLVLLQGLDVLVIKSLLPKDLTQHVYETGVRVWSVGSSLCLNYGGYYTDPDIALCVVRDNIFILPMPK